MPNRAETRLSTAYNSKNWETSSMGLLARKCELGFSLDFADLYSRAGLEKLDDSFLTHLSEVDEILAQRLLAARCAPPAPAHEESELLLALSPHVEDFLGRLFGIG